MTENKKRELLQQYIDGSITPKNRHALEREALDDVFLFEALEGYSKYMKSPELPFYKNKPNAVLPIRTFMTMAASFLVLAVLAFVVKQNLNPSINEEALAQMEVESVEENDQLASFEKADIKNDLNADVSAGLVSTMDEQQIKQIEPVMTSEPKRMASRKRIQEPTMEPESNANQGSVLTESITENRELEEVVFLDESDQNLITQVSMDADSSVDEILERKSAMSKVEKGHNEHKNEGSDSSTVFASTVVQQTHNFVPSKSRNIEHELEQELEESISESEDDRRDSTQFSTKRRSFPVGGWNLFNEELELMKKDIACAGFSYTFKFEILSDGNIENLTVIKQPDIYKAGSKIIKECLDATKEFIEEYGQWETIPPNRVVKRTLRVEY